MKWYSSVMAALFLLAIFHTIPVQAQVLSDAQVVTRMGKARAGDVREQFLLGLMYERGSGVAQNYTEAAHWYGKAAQQNHALAQVSLGSLYDKGLGFAQSYEQALTWYYSAAALGNVDAMYFIGSMAYSGDGMLADSQKALVWFEKASKLGHAQGRTAYEQLKKELARAPASEPAPKPEPTQNPARTTPPVLAASAPSPPQTTPQATTKPVVKAGGFAVQVGSFRTQEQALSHWARLQRKNPDVFVKTDADIYKKEFESGRVFYRLNADFFPDRIKANTRCAKYKSKNIDCLVVKY